MLILMRNHCFRKFTTGFGLSELSFQEVTTGFGLSELSYSLLADTQLEHIVIGTYVRKVCYLEKRENTKRCMLNFKMFIKPKLKTIFKSLVVLCTCFSSSNLC